MNECVPETMKIFDWNEEPFLSEEGWKIMMSFVPSREDLQWRQAPVYDTKIRRTRISMENRQMYKIFDTRHEVTEILCQNVVMKALRHYLKTEDFEVFLRPFHVEWLLYEEGHFCGEHQDFEKYQLEDMMPYVLIVGLEDTIEGGETCVEERVLNGSCRKNRAVFFPANLIHSSNRIRQGKKLCLKLDVFVFQNTVNGKYKEIRDESGQYRSFWPIENLKGSFVNAFYGFQSNLSEKNELILRDKEWAKSLRDMMVSTLYPSLEIDESYWDMTFPDMSPNQMNQYLAMLSFVKDTKQFICFRDASIHMMGIDMPVSIRPFVGLWVASSNNPVYRIKYVMGMDGETFCEDSPSGVITEDMSEQLKRQLSYEFVNTKEWIKMKTSLNIDKHLLQKKRSHMFIPYDMESILNTLEFNTSHLSPHMLKGEVLETEREWCNDDGYTVYTYEEYQSFQLLILWGFWKWT